MACSVSPSVPYVAGLLTAAFAGFVSGFVAHLFTGRRAKTGRRRELVYYLAEWESDTAGSYRNPSAPGERVVDRFKKKKHQFAGMAARMEDDYSGGKKEEFRDLAKTIRDMKDGKVDSEDGQEQLHRAISELLKFVREN